MWRNNFDDDAHNFATLCKRRTFSCDFIVCGKLWKHLDRDFYTFCSSFSATRTCKLESDDNDVFIQQQCYLLLGFAIPSHRDASKYVINGDDSLSQITVKTSAFSDFLRRYTYIRVIYFHIGKPQGTHVVVLHRVCIWWNFLRYFMHFHC